MSTPADSTLDADRPSMVADPTLAQLASRIQGETGEEARRNRGFVGVWATSALITQLMADAEAALDGDLSAAGALRACLLDVWDRADPGMFRSVVRSGSSTGLKPGLRRAAETIAVAAAQAAAENGDVEKMLSALAGLFAPFTWADFCLSLPVQSGAGRLRSFLLSTPYISPAAIEFARSTPSKIGPALHLLSQGGLDDSIASVVSATLPGRVDLDDLFPKQDIPVGKARPKLIFDPEVPGGLRLDVSLNIDSCILQGAREIGMVRDSAPRWEILTISPQDACPGSIVTLRGSGFGTSGTVEFPSPDGSLHALDVREWSDTKILVVVPVGACPGLITLGVPAGTARVCGQSWPVLRAGSSTVAFSGGIPSIRLLQLDWAAGPIVSPGSIFQVHFSFTGGEGVTGQVVVNDGVSELARFDNLVSGQETLSLRAPNASSPHTLTIRATASSTCGQVRRALRVLVAVEPTLSVAAVEMVQGVQRPDPLLGDPSNIELARHRATAVRVMVTSGLPPSFTWGTSAGSIPVTGTLQIGASTLVPSAELEAQPTAAREAALTFVLPEHLCDGTQHFRIIVRPAHRDVPIPALSVSRTMSATFGRTRHITLTMLRIWDRHGHRPAPSESDWWDNARALVDRMPLSWPGILVRAPLGGTLFSTRRDLSTRQGWEGLLNDIDEFAAGHVDHGDIWLGLTPLISQSPTAGIGRARTERGILERDLPPACAVQPGHPASFVHEIGHTLGFDHTEAPEFPLTEDERNTLGEPTRKMPGNLEADALGWRASDGMIFARDWPDLMSYGTPATGNKQDRWPTAAMWQRMLDIL